MYGGSYGSIEEFVSACKESRDELAPAAVLGKMYKVEMLRSIATSLDIDISEASGSSRKITYSTADIIADAASAEVIGDKLSDFDHSLRFPVLTYYQIPNNIESYASYKQFKITLKRAGVIFSDGYWQNYNGLTEPPSHKCSLESVKAFKEEKVFSLLCSCCRALVLPEEKMIDHDSLFLARIPVLIRIFFDLGLVEFSMPLYSEPIAGQFGYEFQAPKRYQQAFQSAYSVLRGLTDSPLNQISYPELPTWFEQKYDAEDMGWKILPRDDADFDLTQNCVPLKEIIDGFMYTLESECTALGRNHILEGIDLYHVFRSLQTKSHTHTMVQRIPFGQRGGGLVLTVYYGTRGAQYYPVILLDTLPTDVMLGNLRDAISELRNASVESQYSINSLLVDLN